MNLAEAVFWISSGLIVYTYAVYPLVLFVIAAFRAESKASMHMSGPVSVSVLISFFNEEKVLLRKMHNISSWKYPGGELQVVLGSDGSTDQSEMIVSETRDPKITLVRFPQRRGKAAVLNDLVRIAQGEIIVFSDANTMYDEDTVHRLIDYFSDPRVGAVCGNLILEPQYGVASDGEFSYWKYESVIKQLESKVGTLIGATGGVYAIRKNLFTKIPTDKSVADDFFVPLHIVRQGYRVVYAPEARAREETDGSVGREFERKTRIGAQNFTSIREFRTLLHPRHGFVSFELWSHKIIRWFVPFLLIAMFASSMLVEWESEALDIFRGAVWVFVGLAVLGFFLEKMKLRAGVVGLPYYFVAVNAALFVGFFRFLTNAQKPMWKVNR